MNSTNALPKAIIIFKDTAAALDFADRWRERCGENFLKDAVQLKEMTWQVSGRDATERAADLYNEMSYVIRVNVYEG